MRDTHINHSLFKAFGRWAGKAKGAHQRPGLNEILELGLRIATGLLITFAAGLVLLAAEVRFGAQPEALNDFRVLATMGGSAKPTIQGLE